MLQVGREEEALQVGRFLPRRWPSGCFPAAGRRLPWVVGGEQMREGGRAAAGREEREGEG